MTSSDRRRRMLLSTPVWSDLLRVCENLRDVDRRECEASRYDASPLAIAREFYLLWPSALVAHVVHALDPYEPVAILMINRGGAGQAHAAMLATERFPEVGTALTRHVLRLVRPALIEAGIMRVECRTLIDHHVSRRWLRFLGAVEEAEIPDGGKNGETFVQYAWRRSDVSRKNVQSLAFQHPAAAAYSA